MSAAPLVLFRVTALAALILTLVACGDRNADDETAPVSGVPVETALAVREAIAASYSGTAALEAERESEVAAKTSGVLLKLLTEEGQSVTQGQVLAQLDSDRAAVELKRAEANLSRLQNNFKRGEELFRQNLISTDNFDQLKADLATQRAGFELAKLELSYTRITAPIDGVITRRLVKEGNLIQLNQTLFRIDDFDPLLAVLNVPERELAIMRPGLPVRMLVDALPGRVFEGAVARVSPVVESGTGTFRVTAEFRDPQARLTSGMFGRLQIVYDTRSDALTIPREALIEEDGEALVYVIERGIPTESGGNGRGRNGGSGSATAPSDGGSPGFFGRLFGREEAAPEAPPEQTTIAKRRQLQLGFTQGDRVEVLDGLKSGERVVTVGRAALRDGVAVQVLDDESSAPGLAQPTPQPAPQPASPELAQPASDQPPADAEPAPAPPAEPAPPAQPKTAEPAQ